MVTGYYIGGRGWYSILVLPPRDGDLSWFVAKKLGGSNIEVEMEPPKSIGPLVGKVWLAEVGGCHRIRVLSAEGCWRKKDAVWLALPAVFSDGSVRHEWIWTLRPPATFRFRCTTCRRRRAEVRG
jgi:hypothetical protein